MWRWGCKESCDSEEEMSAPPNTTTSLAQLLQEQVPFLKSHQELID